MKLEDFMIPTFMPPYRGLKRPLFRIDSIVVHCSATDGPHTPKDVHQWHLSRGWKGCGYHIIIDQNGEVHIGRTIDRMGAHCPGKNMQSVGVCLLGLKKISPAQVKKMAEVIQDIQKIFTVKFDRELKIFPHRFFDSTRTCPHLTREGFKDILGKDIFTGDR